MSESAFDLDLEELSSAEDFLEYFAIAYDATVVHVHRLHILQRFHDYLEGIDEMPTTDEERRLLYAGMLNGAYSDFVSSDARTEKVFRVFQKREALRIEIPIANLAS